MDGVLLISPTGEVGTVDQSEVARAVRDQGYRVASPTDLAEAEKEHQYGEGLGNIAKAGLEGAARSASFGASDALLPHLPFGPTKEALSERQKRNPVASSVGEAAGILGSLALAPEGGLAGIVGNIGKGAGELAASKTASNILGKVGGAAVGNAVQGAFYGAGRVLSEDALGDPGLTAQKAISQVGLSALLSGALGGVLKAGELAAPKVIDTAKTVGKDLFTKASSLVSTGKEESDSLLGLGSIGMAAHSLGIPGKAIGAAIGAYEALKHPEVTMARLANLEGLIKKASSAIAANSNAIFMGGLEGAKSGVGALASSYLTAPDGQASREELAEQYDKAVDKVSSISAHPELFMQTMNDATESLYPHAPEVTGQIHQTAANALQFLQSKIPKPGDIAPLSEKFQPSQAQMGDFLHYYEIVNNPIDSLKEVQNGTLTAQTVEALGAVHPKLYADMQKSLIGKVMEKRDQIPYQKRTALSMFLGEPLDVSLKPSSIVAAQSVYASPQKSSEGTGGMNSRSHGISGLSKLNVASRARTGLQKVNLGQKL